MSKSRFKLRAKDRKQLEEIVRQGKGEARVFKRASGLLSLEEGKPLKEIGKSLSVASVTVAAWRDSYRESGLKFLQDAPRPGRPRTIDGTQRAKITALACSEAPEGYSQWSLRLLADKVIELGYCDEISHTQVGKVLKKTNSSRTSKKRGASGR